MMVRIVADDVQIIFQDSFQKTLGQVGGTQEKDGQKPAVESVGFEQWTLAIFFRHVVSVVSQGHDTQRYGMVVQEENAHPIWFDFHQLSQRQMFVAHLHIHCSPKN